jgi:cyanophycinase-like exopeptidase
MKIILLLTCVFLSIKSLKAQNFTSYFTGNQQDMTIQAMGGVCLMGGASEDDNAMKWFLEKANGGDVLILRTSGADGYNNYMYNTLGVNINSVETIVCNNAAASNENYIHERIQKAEAIWFAGGNQWTYISYWRNTPIDSLINIAISERNIAIGGTSAGMAIMGDYYFSAQNGTISSTNALQDPYNSSMTVDSIAFINNIKLQNTITDTHFDNPDRKGRLMAFMSRIYNDYNIQPKAIACDEYTAVCIDNNGIAKVYGGYPQYDDFAYFVQVNCEIPNPTPEICNSAMPLTWSHNNQALKICKIPGTESGDNNFNLNDWLSNTGGNWFNWSANQGVFSESIGSEPNCLTTIGNLESEDITWSYNPNEKLLVFKSDSIDLSNCSLVITNLLGQSIDFNHSLNSQEIQININDKSSGILFIKIMNKENVLFQFKTAH